MHLLPEMCLRANEQSINVGIYVNKCSHVYDAALEHINYVTIGIADPVKWGIRIHFVYFRSLTAQVFKIFKLSIFVS